MVHFKVQSRKIGINRVHFNLKNTIHTPQKNTLVT
jgi:hypothetical protein